MKKQHDNEPDKATFYRGFKIIHRKDGFVNISFMYGTDFIKKVSWSFETLSKSVSWINTEGRKILLAEIVKTHNIATSTNGHDARREHGELIKVLADIIGE